MITNIQNTVQHPIDSTSLLNWMLGRWNVDPYMPLIVITRVNDGESLNNRLRVQLAKVRGALRRGGIKDTKQFGIKTQIIPWTDSDGSHYDALCLERFVTPNQRFAAIFAQMPF